jgi:hypothetical protein
MATDRFKLILLCALLALGGCDALARGMASLLAGARTSPLGESKEFVFRNLAYEVGKLKYERAEFESLDELLAKAEAEGQRTPSGLWRYGVVLSGVKDAIGDVESAAAFAAAEAKARRWLATRPSSHYAPLVLAYVYEAKACNCARRGRTPPPPAERQAWNLKALGVLAGNPQSNAVGERHSLAVQLADHIGYEEGVVRAHYRNGVRVQPGYFPARFAWVSYLARRPDGARRVEQAARETRAEPPFPDRDSLYARMLWWAAQTEYGDELFEKVPVDWPTFEKSFDAMLAAYPDGWNRNNYARFACLAGHRDRAAALMQDHEPMAEVWQSQEEFDACTTEAVRA